MYTDSLKEFMILRLFRFAYLISISYTYWLIEYKFKADKKLIETEIKGIEDLKKTTRLEKEKLRAELNYLRLQINPHFLFNTLSFIYTEVISHSEKASKSIMLLSNIMRNAFIATDQEGKIPLSHEVKHLENLIEIHQLRFDRQLNINLYLPEPDSLNNINISPFILITFVENLFKHGDLKNERNAAEIRLTVENQQVRFYIRNRKKIRNPNIDFHNNIISDKIGVINVKKRLKLTYPNLHTLDIIDDGKFYTVCLTLNIEDANLHNNR